MNEIKDLSKMTVGEYLEIIINGSEEDPIIEQFNKSIINKSIKWSRNRSQAKATISALGYVCRECEFYIEAGKKSSHPDVKPYVRVDFYENIPIFKVITGAIRTYCFNSDIANFRNPENFTSDFDDRMGKITEGITPDSSLKDFFIQICKYVKDDKKEKMQVFIKEAFGINYEG